MPEGFIPGHILSTLALATAVSFMFHLGTQVTPGEIRAAWRAPVLMLRAVLCSAIAVPVVVIAVARGFELPRAAQVGMALMAICPGAPVALRRALGAGGATSFALALQVTLAFLAVVTVPVWLTLLDAVYDGTASISPHQLAGEVIVGQLVPLVLGFAARKLVGTRIQSIQPSLAFLTTLLLFAFVALAAVNAWAPVAGTGGRVVLAFAVATGCALALGHVFGGPDPGTRTALAVACAARNAGLAMIVAIVNDAPPAIKAVVLGYIVVSALVATPYVLWRGRSAQRASPASQRV